MQHAHGLCESKTQEAPKCNDFQIEQRKLTFLRASFQGKYSKFGNKKLRTFYMYCENITSHITA